MKEVIKIKVTQTVDDVEYSKEHIINAETLDTTKYPADYLLLHVKEIRNEVNEKISEISKSEV